MPATARNTSDAASAARGAAVLDFIQAAAALHQMGSALHGDEVVEARAVGAVSARLTRATADLAGIQIASPATRSDIVVQACRKVGQDLLVKLPRLEGLTAGGDDAVVEPAMFCAVWPSHDLDVLGVRLTDLKREWSEIHPGGENHDVLLSQLTIGSPVPEIVDNDREPEPEKKNPPTLSDETMKLALKYRPSPPKGPRYAADGILNDFFLDSLAYKSMHDREGEVTQAHENTFEWIFGGSGTAKPEGEQFSHSFTTWLDEDALGPIYWINGKPGSGKSSLMRFLFEHPHTWEHLEKWAGSQPVSKAGFFFWTSGSREQRSQTGLLRYLLHQLLSTNQELMPQTFPELWSKLRTMPTKERIHFKMDWTAAELLDAFHLFTTAALPQMKICLFIDGLDEFEGDHRTIIDFFKDLGTSGDGKSVKMCLSSRPWPVFENAFEYAVPHLRLQDLTYGDMYLYAKDRLRGNVHVRRVLKRDAESGEQLLKEIVERADGVFLWVRLALNEMLDKFQSGMSISGLRTTLKTLPRDLNELFHKFLFKDQTDAQVAETATIYQLIRAREAAADFINDESAASLTVWEIAFALEKDDDGLAVNGAVEEASETLIISRCETTTERIQQRFARLLDFHGRQREGNMRAPRFEDDDRYRVDKARRVAQFRVTFIHRTVRDWLLQAPGVHDALMRKSPANFDPHLRLLRSYVLGLKRPLEEIEHHRRLDEWWPDVSLAMTHARYVSCDPANLQQPFLNELNAARSYHWLDKPKDPYDHWARNAFGSYEMRMMAKPIWQPFLCLATKFGLTRYVCDELDARNRRDGDEESLKRRELENEDAIPLLAYATEYVCSRNKTMFPLSDPALVKYLLSTPCRLNPGPNHEYTKFVGKARTTPWLALLSSLRTARRREWISYYDLDPEGTRRWAEIVRLFIEVGGSDVNAVIVADKWDPEISSLGVIELLEETYGAVEVKELKELMVRYQN